MNNEDYNKYKNTKNKEDILNKEVDLIFEIRDKLRNEYFYGLDIVEAAHSYFPLNFKKID